MREVIDDLFCMLSVSPTTAGINALQGHPGKQSVPILVAALKNRMQLDQLLHCQWAGLFDNVEGIISASSKTSSAIYQMLKLHNTQHVAGEHQGLENSFQTRRRGIVVPFHVEIAIDSRIGLPNMGMAFHDPQSSL